MLQICETALPLARDLKDGSGPPKGDHVSQVLSQRVSGFLGLLSDVAQQGGKSLGFLE